MIRLGLFGTFECFLIYWLALFGKKTLASFPSEDLASVLGATKMFFGGLPTVRGKILRNQTSSVCGKQESAQRGIFANPSQRGNDISAVRGKSQSIMRDEMERGCLLKKHIFYFFGFQGSWFLALSMYFLSPVPVPGGKHGCTSC